MNDINLLKYHGRTASEVNMLLAGEMADKLFSRLVLDEFEERAGPSRLVLSLTMLASFTCALFASYVIYNVTFVSDMKFPSLDKQAILKKVEEYKLEIRTGGDPYLKKGYEKIAVIEQSIDDDGQPILVESEYKAPIDIEKQPELFIKPVELTEEPKARKRDKRALITPVFTGNNAIRFNKVTVNERAKIKVLAESNDFKMNLVGSVKKNIRKYLVYKVDKNGTKVIAGKKVRYLKTFKNRNDAVKYMKSTRVAGVVATDTTYYDLYDIEVCCLGEEAAEKLARGSGISMKKIKILKK